MASSVDLDRSRLDPPRFELLGGGQGCSLLSATPGPDLAAAGYTDREYAVSGTAVGVTPDGPVEPAPFTTRVVVRRPESAEAFDGTVVVEWLNVSSGSDACPEYTYVAAEVVRAGHAWVGVSAQFVGIEGGLGSVGLADGAPTSLAGKDPERYGRLHHPGDAFCHSIYATIGAALRDPADTAHPLHGLRPQRLLAVGESQSAMALTTHVNDFAADHRIFDGYLIHSRAAAGLPLGGVGTGIDVTTTFAGAPAPLRTDLDTPILVVQTETDILTNFRYHLVRQPDTERLRVWELAGTAHADLFQVGPFEEYLGCPDPVNRGQQRFVLRAGLRHLRDWVADGTPPPHAQPLELDSTAAEPGFVLDEIGNVAGGVRTPCVDAPTQVLSGIVADPVSRICLLFGSTHAAPEAALVARHGTRADYERGYAEATDAVIAAGFALEDDRAELLADAHPELIPDS